MDRIRDHSLFMEQGGWVVVGATINPGDSKRGHHEIGGRLIYCILLMTVVIKKVDT